jgi:hypothetical protein
MPATTASKKPAQDPRVFGHELCPEILFTTPARGRDGPKLEKDAAVDHVGALHDLVDRGQNDRTMGAPDDLVMVGKEPPG